MKHSYAELRCKTNFSFLEGASHPHEIVEKAKELELHHVAITDRNGLYGVVRAYSSSHRIQQPILIGSEISLSEDHRESVILLAQTRKGYGNLCRLISSIQQRAAPHKVFARMEDIDLYHNDLIAIATAPYKTETISLLGDIFPHRLWIALHRTLEASDIERSITARNLSKTFSVPIVATNDVHYHTHTRQKLQDVLTAIRHKIPVDQAGYLLFSNAERRLKSARDIWIHFRDLPHALEESVIIAKACSFALSELRYNYPNELVPQGISSIQYLKDLTWTGANNIYSDRVPQSVGRQIEHELKLIEELHFSDYFLTLWDIVQYARSQGILCQGRGSAANSAVCFCLGITSIDPVRMNLLFERFISAERGEPPDIDVDFEHERREEVIQYIYRKYGRDRAGIAAEVITYKARSALRDISKALGLSHQEAISLSKRFSRKDFGGLDEHYLKEKGYSSDDFSRHLLELVHAIEGFPRHIGTHVGGFVLTNSPLIELVPIEKSSMPNRTILQWDKNDLDTLQILKVDILGLGMLTMIRKCFDLLREHEGKSYTLATLPAEDPKVYDQICQADTLGVFQIESRAQMSMLPRLKPRNFHDLVIEVAIVRPGPIQGGMVHPFLRRRRGEEPVRFAHPKLQPILAKTYGVPLFQEQVMKMAMAVADFSPGEADELRRAMGMWRTTKSKSMHELAQKLIQRMKKNGISNSDAMEIFHQIESFGEFGFPESHSASFALLVYASAFLKTYHPAAFACSLLNSQPMGFYAPHSILDDARRHGVSILPVDVCFSNWECTLENGKLRLGLQFVRSLGEIEWRRLDIARSQDQFSTLEDFVARVPLSTRNYFFLASSNAFQSFKVQRREALWKLESLYAKRGHLDEGHTQEESEISFSDLSAFEKVKTDYQVLGLSIDHHPVRLARRWLAARKAYPIDQLPSLRTNQKISVGGMVIVRQRPPSAKGMVFLTAEDETGLLNVALGPREYKRFRSILLEEPFLLFYGILQKDGLAMSLWTKSLEPIPLKTFSEFQVPSRNFH